MYLRSMKILQDELQNPKVRDKFEIILATIVGEETEKFKKETSSGYLSKDDVVIVSERVAKRYAEEIIKGKF